MLDWIASDPVHCSDIMCLFLPLGYALLTADLFYDLQWCLFPSRETEQALRRYYTSILTPKIYNPGFLLPFYAIFVFLGQCPNYYNWVTFALFVPIGARYITILKNKQGSQSNHAVENWWRIIVLRIGLFLVTYLNIQDRGCSSIPYHQRVVDLYHGTTGSGQ